MIMQQKTNELNWLKNNARFLSISAIEKEIGCPETTIQKFIKGKRNLPAKWEEKIKLFISKFRK